MGSQRTVSVSRPNSLIIANRRSGFYPNGPSGGSIDGAEHIKVGRIFSKAIEFVY